jgi:Putative zinc ribbon domain
MEKTYKNCQSCGMPLKKDLQGGGTEADGTKSPRYCSRCYQQGKFTKPEMTVEEMQTLVRDKIKEMGFPGFLAGFFTKGIPKLERWATSSAQ